MSVQIIKEDYEHFLTKFLPVLNSDPSSAKNVFFSPLSIFICLHFLLPGLGGSSRQELLKLLASQTTVQKLSSLKDEELPSRVSTMIQSILASESNAASLSPGLRSISIANGLFVDEVFPLLPKFLHICDKYFKSQPELLKFHSDPDNSRVFINNWVEKQTDSMIKELLPDGSITKQTVTVLVNTIFFCQKWENQFDPERTLKNQDFKTFDDKISSSNVEYMMKPSPKEMFYSCPEYKSLTLPYIGKHFKITFIKPMTNKKSNLDSIESQLFSQPDKKKIGILENIQGKETLTDLSLMKIPKLNMEHGTNLNDIMKKLGVTSIFDHKIADFTNMTPITGQVFEISDIIHKAKIEMDEKGTKAAAATAIVMKMRCMAMNPVVKPDFILDSPFVFVISHQQTVIFYGKITNL